MSTANTKVSMDQLILKSLYFRFKDFITPVGVIVVCLITCWLVVVPQIQNWFTMQAQIVTDTQQLSVLKQNLNAVTLMNDGDLDSQLTVASNALPTDKDFTSIVNALQTAALASGTQLGDYNFQIGDLTGVDSSGNAKVQQQLQLAITLAGDLSTAKAFVANLRNQLPLSDVTTISQNSDLTVTATVVFYYAPLPKITFNDAVPLQVISGKDEEFLKSLGETVSPSVVPVVSPTVVQTPTLSPTLTPQPTSGQESTSSAR